MCVHAALFNCFWCVCGVFLNIQICPYVYPSYLVKVSILLYVA